MRTCGVAILGLVLASTITARAEDRSMVVTVGGGGGAVGTGDVYDPPQGFFSGRLSLSWEHAPLEIPVASGTWDAGVDLVPELLGGAFLTGESVAGYVGAGLRAELKLAQRDMGLLKVTARSNAYFALRGLVVGEDRVPIIELGIGQNFIRWHNWTRVGYEINFLLQRNPTYRAYDEYGYEYEAGGADPGVMFQLYLAWSP